MLGGAGVTARTPKARLRVTDRTRWSPFGVHTGRAVSPRLSVSLARRRRGLVRVRFIYFHSFNLVFYTVLLSVCRAKNNVRKKSKHSLALACSCLLLLDADLQPVFQSLYSLGQLL